jgi:site-specific DNA-cytosine methylase
MDGLTIGSLFSGIGGLELGLEHATGGRVCWQVERDAWCRDVLAKHWPDAVRYDDVCTVNGLPAVDLICGGFPCQDVSLAGKRAGFAGERSSLWREYRRIIADVGPRLVFVENVPGLLTADDGWAFGEVLGDLAALGFDATWDVFRASDVGAPHRRERLFLLAYRVSGGCDGVENGASRDSLDGSTPRREEGADRVANGGQIGGLADSASLGGREPADEGVAIAARGGARLEPGRGGESPVGDSSRGVRQRPTSGHGRHAAFADQGLADTEQREGGQRHDADVLGRRAGDAEQTRVGGGDRTGVDQVDPDGERGAERDRGAVAASTQHAGTGGRSGRIRGGSALPRLGRDADGLPRQLDDHRWPAGRGEAQHPGEPPRAAAGVPQRAARLKALGNAVVPQVAALAWRVLYARTVRARSEAA